MRDLDNHFRNGRVDLPRHDGGSRGESGNVDFHETGARTGPHESEVFADLGKCHCHFFENAGDFNDEIRILETIEKVFHRFYFFTVLLAQFDIKRIFVTGSSTEAGADCASAHNDFEAAGAEMSDFSCHTFNNGGVAAEFLAESEGQCVLNTSSSDFNNVLKFFFFLAQGGSE